MNLLKVLAAVDRLGVGFTLTAPTLHFFRTSSCVYVEVKNNSIFLHAPCGMKFRFKAGLFEQVDEVVGPFTGDEFTFGEYRLFLIDKKENEIFPVESMFNFERNPLCYKVSRMASDEKISKVDWIRTCLQLAKEIDTMKEKKEKELYSHILGKR